MNHTYQPQSTLRDVTLRDGLQLTGKLLPTERKVEIARALLSFGVPELEIGSMARGDCGLGLRLSFNSAHDVSNPLLRINPGRRIPQ